MLKLWDKLELGTRVEFNIVFSGFDLAGILKKWNNFLKMRRS